MLIFSDAQVPTYRRGRAGDASDGRRHSTVSVMRWHFYNRLLAAVSCGWFQLNQHGFDSAHVSTNVAISPFSSVPPLLWAGNQNRPQNVVIFMFNANLLYLLLLRNIQTKAASNVHRSNWVMWHVQFWLHFPRFTSSPPLVTLCLVMLRPWGCSAPLSWSEMRIFSAPCVHHFILININLMR